MAQFISLGATTSFLARVSPACGPRVDPAAHSWESTRGELPPRGVGTVVAFSPLVWLTSSRLRTDGCPPALAAAAAAAAAAAGAGAAGAAGAAAAAAAAAAVAAAAAAAAAAAEPLPSALIYARSYARQRRWPLGAAGCWLRPQLQLLGFPTLSWLHSPCGA